MGDTYTPCTYSYLVLILFKGWRVDYLSLCLNKMHNSGTLRKEGFESTSQTVENWPSVYMSVLEIQSRPSYVPSKYFTTRQHPSLPPVRKSLALIRVVRSESHFEDHVRCLLHPAARILKLERYRD